MYVIIIYYTKNQFRKKIIRKTNTKLKNDFVYQIKLKRNKEQLDIKTRYKLMSINKYMLIDIQMTFDNQYNYNFSVQ